MLRMPAPEEPPASDEYPALQRDTAGEVVGLDGQRLPRTMPDIPCRHCQQHPRCIAAEQCLGPLPPHPGLGRLGERLPTYPTPIAGQMRPPLTPIDEDAFWKGVRADPVRPQPPVGEPHIPGSGGINALRGHVHRGLVTIASTDFNFGAGADRLTAAMDSLEATLEGTSNPHAEAALGALAAAHNAGIRVSQHLARALEELNTYNDSL